MCGHALLDILGNSHDEVVPLDARNEAWLGSISGGFLVRPRFLRFDELWAEMAIARRLTNAPVLASDYPMCDLYVGASRH
jgi:hypothetical protein